MPSNHHNKYFMYGAVALFLLCIGVYQYWIEQSAVFHSTPLTKQDFVGSGLKTNTAHSSIPLEKVLDGGPGKDGIPALTNPLFVSVTDAQVFVKDEMEGILVAVGQTTRFYPYNILVWHEVVNDRIEGKHLVVTFCPLCGSAIVFDADVEGKPETFGVSGKLYESNLLMYDKTTESLWSQIRGEAAVGDMTGKKLSLYPSQVLSFRDVKVRYPHAEVLSTKTGYSRDYNFYPYGDYNKSENIYFPISVNDNRLTAKERMYVVTVGTHSVAFKLNDLGSTPVIVKVGTTSITATVNNREVEVKSADGRLIPGYYAMWFAWATHHQKDGIVWKK